ncbi:50S ribosomal protein L31 [Rhodothermus bifroesti]|uniref:50S ribosomal protein L31 n=1 Tax=Rhodothermus marinus TaxID=29549 RepID=A0A7V2F799_RHOMR|nr:50S ribosomal protein L31 [Rhodothermus bifroesti]GBD02726.1 50S ribosomal protein L31 [bacterium HR18]
MKKGLHPEYKLITVRLADGSEFQIRSTLPGPVYVSDVDATNHPFYTGVRQYVDRAGRVEKFMRRYGTITSEGIKKGK